MNAFLFQTCVAQMGADRIVSVALISTDPLKRENVLVIACGPTAARVLGSALIEAAGSAESDDAAK